MAVIISPLFSVSRIKHPADHLSLERDRFEVNADPVMSENHMFRLENEEEFTKTFQCKLTLNNMTGYIISVS